MNLPGKGYIKIGIRPIVVKYTYIFFSEHEILREEIKSLQTIRHRLEDRVKELEDDVKKTKEEAEKAAKASK